jgi:hypothetical protein
MGRTAITGAVAAATALLCSACQSDASTPSATRSDAGTATADADQHDPSESAARDCPDTGDALPDDLFCTGLYAVVDATTLGDGVMAYTPGVTLWSDGADKHRYLYLPTGSSIDATDMDAWKFPVGTKAWKDFRFQGRLIETRILWKIAEKKWASGTYVWNADESAATLNTARKATVLPSGYEIPAARDCDKCHHGGADQLLGVEAAALSLPDARGATLTELARAGFLSPTPPVTHGVLPEDATGKAGTALGYLHANCGMPCHSTRGLGDETKLVLRLRASEVLREDGAALDASLSDSAQAMYGQMPTTASVLQAFPGAVRVMPGDHAQSLVWVLAHRRDRYQMPPLVSHVVDDLGTAQLAAWIDAL